MKFWIRITRSSNLSHFGGFLICWCLLSFQKALKACQNVNVPLLYRASYHSPFSTLKYGMTLDGVALWFCCLILKGVKECCYFRISILAVNHQVRLLQVVGMQHGSLASCLAKEFLLHADGVMLLLLEGTLFVAMVSVHFFLFSFPSCCN